MITIYNEYLHEKRNPVVAALYPQGIHHTIAEGLRAAGLGEVETAVLEQSEHGLSADVLARTDVLLWWGHMAHDQVHDAVVGPCPAARAGRHGPDRAALRPLLQDLQAV